MNANVMTSAEETVWTALLWVAWWVLMLVCARVGWKIGNAIEGKERNEKE